MQFDNTRIAIRERDYFDILDLSLRVVRTFAGPIALAWAAGIVPMMLINHWLLADFVDQDFEIGFPFLHMFWMTFLVLYEIPLATAPLTVYLGKAVFAERLRFRDVGRVLWASLGQLLLYQLLLRGWYARWPHMNEVILLEQNPIRAVAGRPISTIGRSAILHREQGGDILARAIFASMLGFILFLSVWLSIIILSGLLLGEWESGNPEFTIMYPLALWIVIGLFTVVRFLSYLDLRIRREGWEVELRMRAEAARLTKGLT